MPPERINEIMKFFQEDTTNDATKVCVDNGIKRSEACRVKPELFFELYCEEQDY